MQLLQLRVQATQEADAKLQADREGNASMRERSQWLEDSRKGPSPLIDIYNESRDEDRRQEALQKLTALCDNARAAKTIVASPTRQPFKAPPSAPYPRPPHSSTQYRPSPGHPSPQAPSPHTLVSRPQSSYSPSPFRVMSVLPQSPTSSHDPARIDSSFLSLEAMLPNTTSNHTVTAPFPPSPHPQSPSAGQYPQQESQPGVQDQRFEPKYNSEGLKTVKNAQHIPMNSSHVSNSIVTSGMSSRTPHPTSNGPRYNNNFAPRPIDDYRRDLAQPNVSDNSSSRPSTPKIARKLTKKRRQSAGPERFDENTLRAQIQEHTSQAAPPEATTKYLLPAQKASTSPQRNDPLRPRTSYDPQKLTAQNLLLSRNTHASTSNDSQRRSPSVISKLTPENLLSHSTSIPISDNKLYQTSSSSLPSKLIGRHPSPLQQNPYHTQSRRSNNTLVQSPSPSPSPSAPRPRPRSRGIRTEPSVPLSHNSLTPSTTPSPSPPLRTNTEPLPSTPPPASTITPHPPPPESLSTYQPLSLNPYPEYDSIPGVIIRDFAYIQRPPSPLVFKPAVNTSAGDDKEFVPSPPPSPPSLTDKIKAQVHIQKGSTTRPSPPLIVKPTVKAPAQEDMISRSDQARLALTIRKATAVVPTTNQEQLEAPKYVLNAPRTIRWRSAFRRGEVTYTSDGKTAQKTPEAERTSKAELLQSLKVFAAWEVPKVVRASTVSGVGAAPDIMGETRSPNVEGSCCRLAKKTKK
ncbi:hypothetical protein B0J14DRAFT_590007 [Halenospora varia]|nr:hypothetical protein B0J14DRAFT_590007 [Halenospora varia]